MIPTDAVWTSTVTYHTAQALDMPDYFCYHVGLPILLQCNLCGLIVVVDRVEVCDKL